MMKKRRDEARYFYIWEAQKHQGFPELYFQIHRRFIDADRRDEVR